MYNFLKKNIQKNKKIKCLKAHNLKKDYYDDSLLIIFVICCCMCSTRTFPKCLFL